MTQLDALIWTVLFELPVGLAAAVYWGERGAGLGRVAVAVVAGSLLTHPFAWPLGRAASEAWGVPVGLGLVELGVTLCEGALLRRVLGWSAPRAYGLAALINGWSTAVGLVPWMIREGVRGS